MQERKRIIWYLIFTACICIGLFNHVIYNQSDYYNLYSGKKTSRKHFDFKFIDESKLIHSPVYSSYKYRSNSPAQVAIGDLNNDGFEDFIFISNQIHPDNKNQMYLKIQMNLEGKIFKNDFDLQKIILKSINSMSGIKAIVILDIDNDGWNDIAFTYNNCVHFIRNNAGKFQANIIPTVCTDGDKRNINLVDVNNDGFVDLYFSSFQKQERMWIPTAIANGMDGGKNILLINKNGKSFVDATDEYGLGARTNSWTAAIADFNNDGFPDILDINDFGFNQYYENDQGKRFIDRTKKSLSIRNMSYSMSGEVADFNNDGQFDVYVSNTNRPSYHNGYNLLLINDKGVFKDVAKKTSTSACGWSWGTSAFEPDRGLESSIFVVNSPSQPINQQERSSLYSSPPFIRKFLADNFKGIIPNANFANVARFPERNCLFFKEGDQYSDIATEVGITDIKGGKAIAQFDYNNDGVSDFIIINSDSSPILYRGEYSGKNMWIGLQLKGTKSNINAIGSVVEIEFDSGKKIKQNYPTNGYQSQSSSRFIFGIPENSKIKSINVKWPSGKLSKVENYEIGKYNNISE